MSKIISRMLVLGLLVSFVQAQAPSRDIDKDAHKATKSDVKSEAKAKDNKGAGDLETSGRLRDVEKDSHGSNDQNIQKKGSDKKGAKGVTKGSPNMAPNARVSGDRQLAGTKNTSASGKGVKKGTLGRMFSRIFGGATKVDGGKSGAAQPKGDGQDQPSGGQGQPSGSQGGQQPKGDKGAPGPKQQGPDDNGGG